MMSNSLRIRFRMKYEEGFTLLAYQRALGWDGIGAAMLCFKAQQLTVV